MSCLLVGDRAAFCFIHCDKGSLISQGDLLEIAQIIGQMLNRGLFYKSRDVLKYVQIIRVFLSVFQNGVGRFRYHRLSFGSEVGCHAFEKFGRSF